MFTYVQSDEYCEKQEMDRTVTTSLSEQQYPLFVKLLGSSKTRQQVIREERRWWPECSHVLEFTILLCHGAFPN